MTLENVIILTQGHLNKFKVMGKKKCKISVWSIVNVSNGESLKVLTLQKDCI